MIKKVSLLVFLILILIIIFGYLYMNHYEGFDNIHNRNRNHHNLKINPPWAMNTDLNADIYKIAKAIVNNVNKKIKTNYILGQFENVIEDYDIEGNKRYVMDFFVYQINNQNVNDVNRRLIVDLTLFDNSKTIQVNTINFSNAIKYQEPNSLQPDPNNDLLILNQSLLGKTQDPMKITFKEVLESDPFDNPKPIDLTNTDRRPWILPLQIQDKSNIRAFPCNDYGKWWDKNGIPLTQEEEKGLPPSNKPKWCYNSYNTATVPQTIVGQRYPSFVKLPSDQADKKYNWMFDRMQGIASFPHGSS